MTNKSYHTTWAATSTLEAARGYVNTAFAASRTDTVASIDDTDSPYAAGDTVDFIDCDCTNGAVEVDLPASPSSGDRFKVRNNSGTNSVTIDGNGKNINGAASDTLASQYSCMVLVYNGTEWMIESEI